MKIVFIVLAAIAIASCATESAQSAKVADSVEKITQVVSSDIVYLDVEYAITESDIFNSEGVSLQRKSDKAQASWVEREQVFQTEAARLQDRYQRGLITTANAQAEQERIQQRAAEFQTTVQAEMRVLEEENNVFTNRTRDLMQRAVNEINGDKKYKFIFNASALIDADTTLNITSQIIEVINRIYAEDQASIKMK